MFVRTVLGTNSVERFQAYSGALTTVIGSRVALDAKITECGCTLAVGIHTASQVYDGRYSSAKDAFEGEVC